MILTLMATNIVLCSLLGIVPGHGSVALHPDGSFYYFPMRAFQGTDLFSYYLDDESAYSTLVPVQLHVRFPTGS